MCGRYSLCAGFDRLQSRLQGPLPPGLAAHYAPRSQVLPGEPLLIQRQENGQLQVGLALWGLLPDWVKHPATAHRCLHARAETVAFKPSFRAAWRHRRCLIPADAFWEQGQWLRRRDGDLFWLAGLWERWIGPDGSELDSCCVLTTAPNALVAPIHRRMPVVIPNGLEQAWLEPTDGHGLRALEPLLLPWDGGDWQADGAAMALDQPQLELDL